MFSENGMSCTGTGKGVGLKAQGGPSGAALNMSPQKDPPSPREGDVWVSEKGPIKVHTKRVTRCLNDQGFEKKWHQSKKFLAYLILMALQAAFGLCALKWGFDVGWPLAGVLVSAIFTMGFVTLAFNGKQAALDSYVRGIAMTGKSPAQALREKDEEDIL